MAVIPRLTVHSLGLSQLLCWGISYYLIGVFGEDIARDLGWSLPVVHGGFTAALVVMGLTSPVIGRMIDRHGGRRVMVAGSVLIAAGCLVLAVSRTLAVYYAAWLCIGLAMRMTLYEAAFAALARIGGPQARRAISQITLLGGLASTTLWPVGHALAAHFGWRTAVMIYAAIALLTIPLHLAVPDTRYGDAPAAGSAAAVHAPLARNARERYIAAALYALIAILANFLNSGMSAHMIGMLTGFGLAASAAVWIATLRGIGQTSARLCEVLFGRRMHPLTLNLIPAAVLPFCFAAGLLSGQHAAAAMVFAFFYGAGNGIITITRGTLPLVLFDPRTYGAYTGRLLMPSFFVAAFAPIAYAYVIERAGEAGALYVSIAVALVILAAALALRLLFRPQR